MYLPSTFAILVLSVAVATAQQPVSSPESLANPDFISSRSKLSLATAASGCKNSPFGGNCPESSPCCSGAGYCGSDPSFCAESCQSSGSFALDSCWPLPMAVTFHDDFKDKSRLAAIKDYNGFPTTADWVIDQSPGILNHAVITDDDKLLLKLNRLEKHPETGGGIGATVHSSRWMKYGTIEARVKTAANVPGPVSSFILISPISGDEIDFEVVGKDPTDMQTNFYYKVQPGHDVDYTHGLHINVGVDTSFDYHTYKLEWTETEMKWSYDGVLKRTTSASDSNGTYPDTPMRVAFGVWDGGYGSPGTADWAGKNTSYEPNDQREYQMLVDWVTITPKYPDNSTEPWPGSKYLKQMETGGNGGSGSNGGVGTGSNSSGNGGSSDKGNAASELGIQIGGIAVLATVATFANAFFA
ncbi:concanavalin A-like lectin/glucanase domain-containing protein [Dissophora ornata]|nr:concanavalin A-like lectin/glucanase domain-containing protein [Dissophora ornata]